MKSKNWTSWVWVLASTGLVGFSQAEEKTYSFATRLSSTTLTGYVDTSAQCNFGTGNINLPPYKFGGSTKADGFNFNVAQLRLERSLDETVWSAGFQVDVWLGPDANALGTQSIGGNGSSDFALRQAYVALRLPVLNGLDCKLGVFDSILGYESVESRTNPNYTRSWGNTIEPQTHTGLLGSYRISGSASLSAGVADTTGPAINNRPSTPYSNMAESYRTYLGSLSLTAPEAWGFLYGSSIYLGSVNGFDPKYERTASSYYVGATVATPVQGLRLGIGWNDLNVSSLTGENWTIAGYTSYQVTQKLSLHGRAEYLKNYGAQKFFVDSYGYPTNPDELLTLTMTAQYDLWHNVLSRVELRWDHSLTRQRVYGGTTANTSAGPTGDLKNAWLLLVNMTYQF